MGPKMYVGHETVNISDNESKTVQLSYKGPLERHLNQLHQTGRAFSH